MSPSSTPTPRSTTLHLGEGYAYAWDAWSEADGDLGNEADGDGILQP